MLATEEDEGTVVAHRSSCSGCSARSALRSLLCRKGKEVFAQTNPQVEANDSDADCQGRETSMSYVLPVIQR